MPKIILLPVSGSAAIDGDVFVAAQAAGRLFDAHFVALHTRPDVRRDVASLAASDGGMASGIDSMIDGMEADSARREKSAADAWHAFCQQNNIAGVDQPGSVSQGAVMTGEWAAETGTEADFLAEYGRTADLIVVGRGDPKWGTDFALMEAALMDSGKPVLIAPRSENAVKEAIDGTIGIAWKDTKEAGAAVRAALPFLGKAAKIIVFTVAEDDDGDKSHLRLTRMLRWHNPNVSIQALHAAGKPPVEVLRDAAEKAGCGLLVMGGYGHTRLREAVFGGFTHAILRDARMPVLMAH